MERSPANKWVRAQTQRGIVAPTEDLRPAVGHYALGDLLGRGSMGEVFAGFALGDHGFQKPVAIKRLLPELTSNRVFIERLSEEVKLLIGVQHRNIVSVLDLARDGNDVFLIMELVYGPSLRKLLTLRGARGLSLGVATYIVYSAAMALEFAHDWPSGTIIHGDVTPSNLLLATSGEVCVTDFGGGGHGLIEVRSAYMAPEQARGEPPTPRSDVFALGVVLYELICGKHPFDGEVVFEQRGGDPRSMIPPRAVNPRIPADLEAICLRALAHHPRQRYQSMQELIDALDQERSGNPLQEGASELAQAILECSPHVVPRHPSTMLSGQSATMTVRSLLRDSTSARRTPLAMTLPQGHIDRLRSSARAGVPAAHAPVPVVPSMVDSGARTTVVIDERARAKLEAPAVHRYPNGTPSPTTVPVAPADLETPTAPARSITPVDSAMGSGDPMPGTPVAARPARRHRWTRAIIAIFATIVMGGIIFAAGFYLAAKDVSPSVAVAPPPATVAQPPATVMPPPATVTPPPAAVMPPPATVASPSMTDPTPPATVQTPPNVMTPSTVSPTFPGEPPVKEKPAEPPGNIPAEPAPPRKKAPGTLLVQTTPTAWVTIGKQKKQAPGAEFTLAPGYYTVRIEFPTLGITETKKVVIESRKTLALNIDREEEVIDKEEETPDKGGEKSE